MLSPATERHRITICRKIGQMSVKLFIAERYMTNLRISQVQYTHVRQQYKETMIA
jgi:hypothetical protein